MYFQVPVPVYCGLDTRSIEKTGDIFFFLYVTDLIINRSGNTSICGISSLGLERKKRAARRYWVCNKI